MAVSVWARVWRKSRQKGNALLLMLALADECNEKCVCWPDIASLARKSRMDHRTVQRRLAALVKVGEICIEQGKGGAGRANVYGVLTGLSDERQAQVRQRVWDWGEAAYIYLIRKETTHIYKIGLTRQNPKDRLVQLQCGSPDVLCLVAFKKIQNASGVERNLHRRYKERHIRGEWFQLLDAEIASLSTWFDSEENYVPSF